MLRTYITVYMVWLVAINNCNNPVAGSRGYDLLRGCCLLASSSSELWLGLLFGSVWLCFR